MGDIGLTTLDQSEEFVGALESERMLQWFRFAHLPAKLQVVSANFCQLAMGIVSNIPASAERTVALRKLLESKDAAVRAAL